MRNPSPLNPLGFVRSFLTAWAAVSVVRPDVVFSKGGAISVPVALVALVRRIPVVLHESDAVSGRANRLVSLWARKVCKGFPSPVTSHELRVTSHDVKEIFTGNPVRPEILSGSEEEGRRLTGLTGDKPVMLVIGGSQGALALNDVVMASLDQLLQSVQIIHLTGRGKGQTITHTGYWSAPFAYEELKHLYALSDFALSRSGAGAIAELAACGIPAILVPLRGVGHDHQQKNALSAAAVGGCVLLDQIALVENLLPAVRALAENHEERQRKAGQMRLLARPDAARLIAEILVRVGGVRAKITEK